MRVYASTLMRFVGLVLVVVAGMLLAGCGAGGQGEHGGGGGASTPSSDSSGESSGGSGERVEVGSTEALVWGEGDYGVVMSHGAAYDAASWRPQAERIAENGMVALSVEDNSAESLTSAAQYLDDQYDLNGVALLGASAGGETAIQAAAENQNVFDQIVLLSPAGGDASQLGDMPKLFIYSEEEGLADSVQQMAQEASEPTRTVAVPGDAHAQAIFDGASSDRAMQAIIERLERYSGGDNHP